MGYTCKKQLKCFSWKLKKKKKRKCLTWDRHLGQNTSVQRVQIWHLQVTEMGELEALGNISVLLIDQLNLL